MRQTHRDAHGPWHLFNTGINVELRNYHLQDPVTGHVQQRRAGRGHSVPPWGGPPPSRPGRPRRPETAELPEGANASLHATGHARSPSLLQEGADARSSRRLPVPLWPCCADPLSTHTPLLKALVSASLRLPGWAVALPSSSASFPQVSSEAGWRQHRYRHDFQPLRQPAHLAAVWRLRAHQAPAGTCLARLLRSTVTCGLSALSLRLIASPVPGTGGSQGLLNVTVMETIVSPQSPFFPPSSLYYCQYFGKNIKQTKSTAFMEGMYCQRKTEKSLQQNITNKWIVYYDRS